MFLDNSFYPIGYVDTTIEIIKYPTELFFEIDKDLIEDHPIPKINVDDFEIDFELDKK